MACDMRFFTGKGGPISQIARGYDQAALALKKRLDIVIGGGNCVSREAA